MRLFRLMGAAVGLTAALSCFAADPRDEGPKSLVVTYKVAPESRVAFFKAVHNDTLPKLAALKSSGSLVSYHLLASRYVDSQSFDMMAILDFRAPNDLAQWRAVEAATPAGLSDAALKLAVQIDSAPSDLMRGKQDPRPAGEDPVYLVVPYDYLVSTNAYLSYVDGYLLPQTDGWLEEGVLNNYAVYLPRYAAARSWSSLLVLSYRGDAGLGMRDVAVKTVRARLANVPEWKAFADSKQNIRVEKVPMIADELR